MICRFCPKHHIDDLAACFTVCAKCMRIAGAQKGKLPRFQILRDAIDPMRGAPAFDQKHLKEIMVMRLLRKPFVQPLACEMKRLMPADIVGDMKCGLVHEAR